MSALQVKYVPSPDLPMLLDRAAFGLNTDIRGQLESFLERRRAQPARGEVAGPAARSVITCCITAKP